MPDHLPEPFLVFRDSRLNELADQGNWYRSIQRETDRAFARLITFQLRLVRCDDPGTHGIQRAMICPRGEAHQRAPAQTKGRYLITDALPGLWRGGSDHLAKLL